MFKKTFILFYLLSSSLLASGYDVFAIGMYDVKFDGSETDRATDFRYERRFDTSLFEIGPESENFFNLKPLPPARIIKSFFMKSFSFIIFYFRLKPKR